jgi:hypothetical protein
MTGYSISLTGQKELAALLRKAGDQAPRVLAQALTEEAQLMMRDSQKIVPHADGTLASSGVVVPAVISGNRVQVDLGYGGAASKYALRQHEDLDLTHPDYTNPKSRLAGRAHYLSEPVENRVADLHRHLLERVSRILGSR